MASRRLLCGICLSIALAAEATSAPGGFVISGTVLAGPNRPLAGAQVEIAPPLSLYKAGSGGLAGQGSPSIAAAETGADGRFALQAPRAGVFTVSVRRPGWESMQFGSFVVTRSRELPPLTVPAVSDSTIRVVDADGQPVSGAWVALLPRAPKTQASRAEPVWKPETTAAKTNSEGTVVLPIAEGRRMEIEVFVPGEAAAWHVSPEEGIVRLPRRDRLQTVLRVTRSTGEPAEGVLVRVGGYGWPLGVTDAFGGLPLLLPLGTAVQGQLLSRDGTTQAVRLGARGSEAIQVRLTRTTTAEGRVLDSTTGKGLAGALVAPSGDLGSVTTTNDQGRFSLVGSTVEGWAFEVHAAHHLPRRIAVLPRELAGGRLPAVALEPAAQLAGRVLGPGNQPLSGVSIEAIAEGALAVRPFSPSEPAADRSVSGPGGAFELVGLKAAARYGLQARKTGLLPAFVLVSTASPRGRAPAVELRLLPGRAAVGRIVDVEGLPLPGARVTLRPSRREGRSPPETRAEAPLAEDHPAGARSDREGRFLVAQCPAAELDVEVLLDGYAPTRRVGFHVDSRTTPLDLGTLVLRPGAKLAGRVIGNHGQAVRRAEIFLFDRLATEVAFEGMLRGREPDATSGSDGSFVVGALAAGIPQYLVVRAEGFLPVAVRGVRPPTDKPILIRLETGFQLAGLVVDEQSQPVSRAQVVLTAQSGLKEDPYHRPLGRKVSREAVTDANGRFEIHDAPRGKAVLSVSASGFVPGAEIEIELPQPDRAQPLVIRLRGGAVLWGRVSTTDGDGVAGARVVTGDAAAATDAEGSYRLSGVAEGDQRVEVHHPSYRRVLRAVRVEAGENRLDFELPAGVPVDGRVVDSSGDPVAGADVRLRTAGHHDRHEYRSSSDADGRFRLEPVAAGQYRLGATAPDQSSGELRQPVIVDREPIAGLEVVLERGAVLSGRILGLTPDDLAIARVEAKAETGQTREATIEAGGAYRVRALTPGAWLVRASLWQGQKEARARVVIAPADRELARDLEFGRKLTLSGVVLFDEQPLANATLTVRAQHFAVERMMLTSFDGAFRLEDLEPDTYRLGISQAEQFITHNQWVELTDDTDVTIRLAGATVSGMVRDAQHNEPINGALIRLRPTQGPEFLIADSSHEDGSFHLLRVPPGSYNVQVSADGFVGSERALQVTGSNAVDGLDFSLQATTGGLLQVGLVTGGVPQLVHLLVLDAAGASLIAETRAPDASGRVTLGTLPPGNWQLLVSAPAAAMVTSSVIVPGEPTPVSLPPAARLHLHVPALAATDLLATVTLLGPDQKVLWTLGPGGKLQGSWPMTGGHATIEAVPAGGWFLRVESADGRAWTGGVVVAGSDDKTVTLD